MTKKQMYFMATMITILTFCCTDFPVSAGNHLSCGSLSSKYKLVRSAKYGELDKVARYLKRGVKIEATVDCTYGDGYDIQGNTSLILATKYQHADIVELLLRHGANVNARSKYSTRSRFSLESNFKTPLHWASINGDNNIMNLLLKYDPDLNAKDSDGNTPLHDAARKGQLSTVALLLDSNADPSIKNASALSPKNIAYQRAQKWGDWELYYFLKEREEVQRNNSELFSSAR